jgi:uncharacterized protein (DUF2141 family)
MLMNFYFRRGDRNGMNGKRHNGFFTIHSTALITKITLLFILFLCGKTSAQTHTLTIQIINIKNNQGRIGVAVYNSEKDFLKKYYQVKTTKAEKGEVIIVFNNLPTSYYGVSVMHDANENDKLDSNFLGIPKEGFGFSNNAMGTFGPPSFEKAKVEVNTNKSASISMKYF